MLSIWVGTVVTGSGLHAGDLDAVRTGFDIEIVSRLHGLSAWLVVACTIASLWLLRGTGRPAHATRLLLGTVLVQGVIGYTQYFLGVPAWIVALHMVGMTLVAAASGWSARTPWSSRRCRGRRSRWRARCTTWTFRPTSAPSCARP